MSKRLSRNKVLYDRGERSIEVRLLQFYVIMEELWSIANALLCFITRMPKETTIMFAMLAVFLPIYWTIGYYSGHEDVFIKIYFVLFLISIPPMWYFAGGQDAAANILFVCELVAFAMCLKGIRQKIYLVLSMFSTSMIYAVQGIIPGYQPLYMTPMQIRTGSRLVGLSTSLLIIAILIKQKREYAKEKDIAIESERALEKSNQLQKNFLANMSHEIRSPLGIVLGFNELIKESNNLDQIHEYASNIEQAGKTLHTVINDILDYSKIESGKLDIIDADYSFSELISEVSKDIALKCSEKGLNFEVNNDERIPAVLYGDNIRIKQCLLNLLSNAVKYTEKGVVTLKIALEDMTENEKCRIRFDVIDTGRGITEDTIPKLFDAFQRLEEGHNRGIEGTGLGLAITKNLIDEMAGSIEVTSEYGNGSTFTIHLDQKISKKIEAISKEIEQDVDISGVNVLAVDDTLMNLTLIQKLLVKQNAVVTTVDNGAEALEICKDTKYDVILLDHMMPEMDGIETFKRLRKQDGLNKNTPVIMLTANAMAGASQEYMTLGFDGYVSKPIKLKELKNVINKVVVK